MTAERPRGHQCRRQPDLDAGKAIPLLPPLSDLPFLKERPNSERRADVAKTGDLSPLASRFEVYDRPNANANDEGVSERAFLSPLLTERESVLGPLHPAGPVGHLALHDGRAALGHVDVARPRPEELLLLRLLRRLATMVAAASPRGDERGSGIAPHT